MKTTSTPPPPTTKTCQWQLQDSWVCVLLQYVPLSTTKSPKCSDVAKTFHVNDPASLKPAFILQPFHITWPGFFFLPPLFVCFLFNWLCDTSPATVCAHTPKKKKQKQKHKKPQHNQAGWESRRLWPTRALITRVNWGRGRRPPAPLWARASAVISCGNCSRNLFHGGGGGGGVGGNRCVCLPGSRSISAASSKVAHAALKQTTEKLDHWPSTLLDCPH